MALDDQWLICVYKSCFVYGSLGLVFQYPESFQLKTFTYASEAQDFINKRSGWPRGLCNDRTVICEAVSTPDGVTFRPIETK